MWKRCWKTRVNWAFVRPERPVLPEVKNGHWVRNEVDRFVLAKLEERGVAPAPEADRATLVKRLYADLVGLAPTPEEVAAFVSDNAPGAYERLVDRLLTNPHYNKQLAIP